jgi:hypothetical protein
MINCFYCYEGLRKADHGKDCRTKAVDAYYFTLNNGLCTEGNAGESGGPFEGSAFGPI